MNAHGHHRQFSEDTRASGAGRNGTPRLTLANARGQDVGSHWIYSCQVLEQRWWQAQERQGQKGHTEEGNGSQRIGRGWRLFSGTETRTRRKQKERKESSATSSRRRSTNYGYPMAVLSPGRQRIDAQGFYTRARPHHEGVDMAYGKGSTGGDQDRKAILGQKPMGR